MVDEIERGVFDVADAAQLVVPDDAVLPEVDGAVDGLAVLHDAGELAVGLIGAVARVVVAVGGEHPAGDVHTLDHEAIGKVVKVQLLPADLIREPA
ncbi:MAG: hypothetical protein LCH73_09030 [Proteobacteria bacterium]|nr:hypothetical protein [Pseudomonadota bacterium]